MRGKRICNTLKRVRADIAKANGIKYEVTECSHKGECLGTCPKCEAEVKYLERRLAERRRRGLKVTLAGVSAGLVTVSAVSCSNPFAPASISGDMDIDPALRNFGDTTAEETEIHQTLGSLAIAPENDGETDAIDGDMPLVGEPDNTEEDIPTAGEMPDTEAALKGDIAYFPEDVDLREVVLSGMMPVEEPEVYRTEGDIIEPSEDTEYEDEVTWAQTECVEPVCDEPETTAE